MIRVSLVSEYWINKLSWVSPESMFTPSTIVSYSFLFAIVTSSLGLLDFLCTEHSMKVQQALSLTTAIMIEIQLARHAPRYFR